MPVRSKNHTGSENLQHIDIGHLPELWPGNVRVCVVLALISHGRGPPPVEVLGAAWLGLTQSTLGELVPCILTS